MREYQPWFVAGFGLSSYDPEKGHATGFAAAWFWVQRLRSLSLKKWVLRQNILSGRLPRTFPYHLRLVVPRSLHTAGGSGSI